MHILCLTCLLLCLTLERKILYLPRVSLYHLLLLVSKWMFCDYLQKIMLILTGNHSCRCSSGETPHTASILMTEMSTGAASVREGMQLSLRAELPLSAVLHAYLFTWPLEKIKYFIPQGKSHLGAVAFEKELLT